MIHAPQGLRAAFLKRIASTTSEAAMADVAETCSELADQLSEEDHKAIEDAGRTRIKQILDASSPADRKAIEDAARTRIKQKQQQLDARRGPAK